MTVPLRKQAHFDLNFYNCYRIFTILYCHPSPLQFHHCQKNSKKWVSPFLKSPAFSKTFVFPDWFQLTLMSWRTSCALTQQWAALLQSDFPVLHFSPPPKCVPVRDCCTPDRALTQGRPIRWDRTRSSSSSLGRGGTRRICFVLLCVSFAMSN